jgi:fructokinase
MYTCIDPRDQSPQSLRIGVDLGGTKIEAVLLRIDARGELDVLERERVATEQTEGYEAIVERTVLLIERILQRTNVGPNEVSIGVGMPGSVVRLTGVVKNSNTVCLNGRPFRDDLSRRLGRVISFDNDANCFALAEARFGAARAFGEGVVFGVILGTGVGGGVVCNGRVWSGTHGIAGEWGHHAVYPDRGELCYCGKRGCLEMFISGPAVEADYASQTGQRLALADIAQRRARDPHAGAAIDRFLDAFGRGLANVVDILDPSAIVLGGGVSNLDLLYTEGRERVARYLFNDEFLTPLLKHSLGDSAGVLGAALL